MFNFGDILLTILYMVGMQIDEDHDGEDERSDPGSDMDVDDERYIFFLIHAGNPSLF